MDRRDFLKLSLGLTTGGVGTLAALSPVSAQSLSPLSGDVVKEMIFERPWLDPEVLSDLRRLSAAFIELRIVYSGPNGYERESQFANGVWEARRKAFGENFRQGLVDAQTLIAPALDGAAGSRLESQMNRLLEDNRDRYTGWLADIGIAPEGRLQGDFLRAQAYFAIAASITMKQDDLGFFSNFTWIFPFC